VCVVVSCGIALTHHGSARPMACDGARARACVCVCVCVWGVCVWGGGVFDQWLPSLTMTLPIPWRVAAFEGHISPPSGAPSGKRACAAVTYRCSLAHTFQLSVTFAPILASLSVYTPYFPLPPRAPFSSRTCQPQIESWLKQDLPGV
jgi:hypothetical protein